MLYHFLILWLCFPALLSLSVQLNVFQVSLIWDDVNLTITLDQCYVVKLFLHAYFRKQTPTFFIEMNRNV